MSEYFLPDEPLPFAEEPVLCPSVGLRCERWEDAEDAGGEKYIGMYSVPGVPS